MNPGGPIYGYGPAPDRRDDEAVIAEALAYYSAGLGVGGSSQRLTDALAALNSLALRLQNAETALRFYADPSTYEESCEPHPSRFASGVVPIEADNGEQARAALASSTGASA